MSLVFPQNNQNIDGVAAIVEEHLVLKSDLAQMVNMSIIQNKIDPSKDIEKIKALEKTILESLYITLISIYSDTCMCKQTTLSHTYF